MKDPAAQKTVLLAEKLKQIRKNWTIREKTEFVTSRGILFFSYFFGVDRQASSRHTFTSDLWSGVIDKLREKDVPTTWVHLFVKNEKLTPIRAYRQICDLNKGAYSDFEKHYLLDQFVNRKVLSNVFFDAIRVIPIWKKLSLPMLASLMPASSYLWPMIQTDWASSIVGKSLWKNLIQFNIIEFFISKIGDAPRKCVYLHENQSWEIALNFCYTKTINDNIFGYSNATIPFWDLRYHLPFTSFDNTVPNKYPFPKKFLCSGDNPYSSLISSGYPKSRVETVEALRYLYSHNFTQDEGVESSVLVVGELDHVRTARLLINVVSAINFLKNHYSFTFKPHPGCSLQHKKFLNPKKIKISKLPLEVLLPQHSIVVSSVSTSAAVDAYICGLKVIVFVDGSFLNTSPLLGSENVKYVSTGEEMVEGIRSRESVSTLSKNPTYFNTAPELKKWQKILGIIG